MRPCHELQHEHEGERDAISPSIPELLRYSISLTHHKSGTKLLLVYVDGMVDTDVMTTNVLKPLLYDGLPEGLGTIDGIGQMCELGLFAVMQYQQLADASEIIDAILKGNAAVLADGESSAPSLELH